MAMAQSLAKTAASLGEVPVGAVLTLDDRVVATGFNRRERDTSPLAHAEMIALEKASRELKRWRLTGCWLYVTLEPCIMCAGALWQSRIDGVVFGARDPKGGGIYSAVDITKVSCLNHQFQVKEGLAGEETSRMLKTFFQSRRK